MGRPKQGQGRKPKNKREIYFGFKNLRENLKDTEKDFLINFFTGFQKEFKVLQNNLCMLNQKFDMLDSKMKAFEHAGVTDEFEGVSFQVDPSLEAVGTIKDDFVLNDDDLQKILESEEEEKNANIKSKPITKEENREQPLELEEIDMEEIKNLFSDKPETNNDIEDILKEKNNDCKQTFFDYKKYKGGSTKNNQNNNKKDKNDLAAYGLNESYEEGQ